MTEPEKKTPAEEKAPAAEENPPVSEEKAPAAAEKKASAEKKPEKPMDPGSLVLLFLAVLAALMYLFGHSREPGFNHGPGIGLTLTHWILTGTVLVLAGRRGRLRADPAGILLLTVSVLLSAAYGVFANPTMKLLNLPVLLLTGGLGLLALTGHTQSPALSGAGLREGLGRYVLSLFSHWGTPFRALALHRRREADPDRGERVLFGLFLAGGAALLALTLLASADTVFSSLLGTAAEQVTRIDGLFILRLILVVPLALVLFSHRRSLLQAPWVQAAPPPQQERRPTIFCMVLAALSLVYAAFAWVQVRYLFAGVESVRMSGGYAAYARSGFFQLVLVAVLTLCVILPALSLCPHSRAARFLSALAAVLTGVIDFSAFFRMRLYIQAYGLTTLRVVTLWGIGMILLALLAALAKAIRPAWRICPLLAAVSLLTWVGLNGLNMDRLVAENLVARRNAAPAEEGSAAALASDQYWSPDYYPAFGQLTDPEVRAAALALLDARGIETDGTGRPRQEPLPYDWCLSYLRIPAASRLPRPDPDAALPRWERDRRTVFRLVEEHEEALRAYVAAGDFSAPPAIEGIPSVYLDKFDGGVHFEIGSGGWLDKTYYYGYCWVPDNDPGKVAYAPHSDFTGKKDTVVENGLYTWQEPNGDNIWHAQMITDGFWFFEMAF